MIEPDIRHDRRRVEAVTRHDSHSRRGRVGEDGESAANRIARDDDEAAGDGAVPHEVHLAGKRPAFEQHVSLHGVTAGGLRVG